MLIAMTYNYWLILAVCVGNGVGYLINGLIRRCITFSHKESNIENNQKDNNKISSCESTGERNSSYSADEYNNFDNDTVSLKLNIPKNLMLLLVQLLILNV